ncbi:hypothetical protein [Thalassomonas sp. RHCl1]|uniref:hypothetical protein n=1 Tax=Thalassomonas sp. RHCl1 TaxID=2995320 RepID=UPI00248BCBC2|nr:hypothetical protein [Thalassomonas sp. RHCl1]
MKFNIWYLILAVVCFLNFYVSVYIAKRDDLERFQKIAQVIIVWLIPIVGAIGLWLFHRSNDQDSAPGGGSFGGGSHNGIGAGGGGD